MLTIILISAGFSITVTAGVLVGFGLTEQSFRRSWKQLAQQRRLLNERKRIIDSLLVEHYRCQTDDRLDCLTDEDRERRWRPEVV